MYEAIEIKGPEEINSGHLSVKKNLHSELSQLI